MRACLTALLLAVASAAHGFDVVVTVDDNGVPSIVEAELYRLP